MWWLNLHSDGTCRNKIRSAGLLPVWVKKHMGRSPSLPSAGGGLGTRVAPSRRSVVFFFFVPPVAWGVEGVLSS